jgi:hypothetical protein
MRASRDDSGRLRRDGARTVTGLLVAALVFGGAASAVHAEGTAAPAKPAPAAAKPASQVAAPAKPATQDSAAKPAPAVSAPGRTVNAATSKTAPAPAKPAVAPPARTTPVVTKTGKAPEVAQTGKAVAVRPAAASGGAVARVPNPSGPVQPAAVQPAAQLDEHVTYQYNALGRRDPFQPIMGGEFVGADVGGDAPVDVGGMKVVGIMWGASDKFALVEDGRGNSLVLRAGDKVMNGVVETLQREAVVVKLTVDGQTQSVAIPLTRKGDQNNASR